MAYIKNTWVDQEVERPRTYQMTNNADGSVTLIDDFGLVTELGTPVNADYMNHIEEGIEGCAIRVYSSTETYNLDEWVKDGDNLYKSLQASNTGHATSEADYWEEVSLGGGSGLPVGTIISHICSASFVPENSLPCNNTEYTEAQFPTFFPDWLEGGRLLTCTYEEQEQEISTYGKCVKFAIDTVNRKFKTPYIPDGTVIQQAMTDDELGKSYNAGLPNIEGAFSGIEGSGPTVTGAFYNTGISYNGASAGTGDVLVGFDASLSNPIYGNSDTVQPEAVALRYFVVVGTGSINQSEMDWSEWASGLASKVAISDMVEVPTIIETYLSEDGLNGYIVYSNGLCEQWGNATAASDVTVNLLKNYVEVNYCVSAVAITVSSYSSSLSMYIKDKTTLSFRLYSPGQTPSYNWRTIGYIS